MTDMAMPPLDILAIAAHRDDVEQTCGGTLLKMAQRGHRTGILDLTQGEMGTRGSAEDRAREADEAARILKVSWRDALDIPDGRVENTWENRLKVARVIREHECFLQCRVAAADDDHLFVLIHRTVAICALRDAASFEIHLARDAETPEPRA